jgi:hypothetical protein
MTWAQSDIMFTFVVVSGRENDPRQAHYFSLNTDLDLDRDPLECRRHCLQAPLRLVNSHHHARDVIPIESTNRNRPTVSTLHEFLNWHGFVFLYEIYSHYGCLAPSLEAREKLYKREKTI